MKKTKPGWLDPNWVYVPARYTNILKTFKLMGWIPPSEKH